MITRARGKGKHSRRRDGLRGGFDSPPAKVNCPIKVLRAADGDVTALHIAHVEGLLVGHACAPRESALYNKSHNTPVEPKAHFLRNGNIQLALFFAPLGYRKLGGLSGVMRGEALGTRYPVFFDSWKKSKAAPHELWVGQTGSGKTFALNCYIVETLLHRQFGGDQRGNYVRCSKHDAPLRHRGGGGSACFPLSI
jgi:hypothetical protein